MIRRFNCVGYSNVGNSTYSVRLVVGLFLVHRNSTESLLFGRLLAFWPSLAHFLGLEPAYRRCVTLLPLDNLATLRWLQAGKLCKTGEFKIVLGGLCGVFLC